MSLRLKVLLPLVMFSAILVAYLYGYWIPRSRANTETEYRRAVERHLNSVAQGLAPLLAGRQLDTVYEDLDAVMQRNKDWISIRLFDSEGRSIYPLQAPPAAGETAGRHVHVLQHRIRYLGMDLGQIVLAVDFSPTLSVMNERNAQLITTLFIILVCYLLTVVVIVEWVVRRPVTFLARASGQIAEGIFDFPPVKAGNDEVGALVKNFSGMRDAIRDYQSELRTANERLERELAERGRVEKALQESHGSLLTVLNSLEAIVYVADISTYEILFINKYVEDIYGNIAGNICWKSLQTGQSGPCDFCTNRYLLDSGGNPKGVYHWEFRNTFDGRWYDIRDRAISWVDGRIVRMEIAIDMTERKKAEEEIRRLNEELEQRVFERTVDLQEKTLELQDSQRALMNLVNDLNVKTSELEEANNKLKELDRLKSMFIASMSHELRTPLNSIIGFSSITVEEWTGPLNEEQKKNLSIVLRSGKHLLSLINDIIDVSKIEAGKIDISYEDFDLYEVLADSAALFRKDIEEKGLSLNVRPVHLIMHTDRRRLSQCLLNLMSNALKFTERGMIEITARALPGEGTSDKPPGELLMLSVSDTGIGIREEDMPKLFSAFVRIPSPLSLKVRGTGLGLYLVKKIATEILGGAITAESRYGEGSSFCLKIPVKL